MDEKISVDLLKNDNKDIISEMILPNPIEVSPYPFYHRLRTSAELCQAGLFTEECLAVNKKHRKMKCNFCHVVINGWKNKFCSHLDKCKQAQQYFASHLDNIELNVLERQAKRISSAPKLIPQNEKRRRIDEDILTFDGMNDYLNMLACGFVSSCGVTKAVYENEFMQQLHFSLQWHSPSLYALQRKLKENDARIMDSIYKKLREYSSVGLLVYPWTDINRKSSVSFLASTYDDHLYYLSHCVCEEESCSTDFIVKEIQEMITALHTNGIAVSLLYVDSDHIEEIHSLMKQNTLFSSLFTIGNPVNEADDLLASIFSYHELEAMKRMVYDVLVAIKSNKEVYDVFKSKGLEMRNENIELFSMQDNWVSVMNGFSQVLQFYDVIMETRKLAMTNDLLPKENSLLLFSFDEGTLAMVSSIVLMFSTLAAYSDCFDSTAFSPFTLYSELKRIQSALSENATDYFPNVRQFLLDTVSNALLKYFDEEYLTFYYYFIYLAVDNGNLGKEQDHNFLDQTIYKRMHHSYLKEAGWNEFTKEFSAYVMNTPKFINSDEVIAYWQEEGRSQYPYLSVCALMLCSYPHDKDSYFLYKKIKSYIHYHVRTRKDTDVSLQKSIDEMVISCNRHVIIRSVPLECDE